MSPLKIVRDHDRVAHVDRPFDQLRRVSEAAVPHADQHLQRRLLRDSVLRRHAAAVGPSREDVVASVTVEICDGMHEFEVAKTRVGDDAREGDPGRRLRVYRGTAKQGSADGCCQLPPKHGCHSCVPARLLPSSG